MRLLGAVYLPGQFRVATQWGHADVSASPMRARATPLDISAEKTVDREQEQQSDRMGVSVLPERPTSERATLLGISSERMAGYEQGQQSDQRGVWVSFACPKSGMAIPLDISPA